jgi:hypothetical protein
MNDEKKPVFLTGRQYEHKLNIDFEDSWILIAIFIVFILSSLSGSRKDAEWKAVEICMAHGGVPITRLFNAGRLAECQFPPK